MKEIEIAVLTPLEALVRNDEIDDDKAGVRLEEVGRTLFSVARRLAQFVGV
ncbi:MAG: hypothetical protein HYR84_03265 [Planctomycetes bacterium]|nr:hypothetical protein [Planctomycetota bacterium]